MRRREHGSGGRNTGGPDPILSLLFLVGFVSLVSMVGLHIAGLFGAL